MPTNTRDQNASRGSRKLSDCLSRVAWSVVEPFGFETDKFGISITTSRFLSRESLCFALFLRAQAKKDVAKYQGSHLGLRLFVLIFQVCNRRPQFSYFSIFVVNLR